MCDVVRRVPLTHRIPLIPLSVGTPRSIREHTLPAALRIHVQTVAPTTAIVSTRLLHHTSRSRSRGAVVLGEPFNLPSRGDHNEPELESVQSLVLRWPTYAYVPATTDQNALGIANYVYAHPAPQSNGSNGAHDPILP